MANPFFVAARGIDLLGDALRFGKSTGVGRMLSGIGQKVPSWERATIAAHSRNIIGQAGGARGILNTATTAVAGTAARVEVGAREMATKAGIWANTTGKLRGSQAWNLISTNRRTQQMGVAGIMAGVGLATSSPDATPMQKLGRMVGFGAGGVYGMNVLTRNQLSLRGAARGFMTGEFKAGGAALARGLGMPAKWGTKHSIAAGAFYGLVSDRSSVAEGATFGLAAHVGVKGLARNWTGATNRGIYRAFKQKGFGAAFQKMPLGMAGLYAGAMKGAYNNLGEGNASGINVVGGALGGAALGGTIGGGAKFAARHPWITVGTVGPTLSLAGQAGEAAGTVLQAGVPGFDTMNADGDLALALHRMRHG